MTHKLLRNARRSQGTATGSVKTTDDTLSTSAAPSPCLPLKPGYTVAARPEQGKRQDPARITAAMLSYIENYKNITLKNS